MAETPDGSASCPECGKTFPAPGAAGKVLLHRVSAHKYRSSGKSVPAKVGASPDRDGPKRKPTLPLPGEAEVESTVRKAVGFMRGGGALVQGLGGRHLGLTIMGVECDASTPGAIEDSTDEKGKPRYWLVRSRAIMAQPLLIDQAKRDVRVYQMLAAFNRFCEGGTALEVGGGLLAAAAVDAGVPAGLGFNLGQMPVQPIPMVIGDVLEWVAAEDAEAGAPPPEQPHSPNGRKADEPEQPQVVTGGVEAT